MDVTGNSTDVAVEKLQRKQARRARWSKIGGGLLALAFIVRGGVALFAPAQAQECDASEVQTALTDLVNKAAVGTKGTVVTLDRIAAVADDNKLRRCTGHVVFSDKSDGILTYHVDPKNVVIDDLK